MNPTKSFKDRDAKRLVLDRKTVRSLRVTSNVKAGDASDQCRGGVATRTQGCPVSGLCTV